MSAPATLPADFFNGPKKATAEAPDVLPADFFDKQESPTGDISDPTKGYKPPSTLSTVGREGALGLMSGLGIPETQTPLTDLAKGLVPSARDVLEFPIAPLKAGYGIAKGLYGAGKELFAGPQDEPGVAAHGLGSLIGQGLQLGGLAKGGEVAGELPEKISTALEPGRIEKGQARLGEALRTPPGKGGERAAKMDADLQTVTQSGDLPKIQRDMPVQAKGAERFGELADKIYDYRQELWDKGHNEQVARHRDAPFDNQAVLSRALSAIKKGHDVPQATAAREWAQREIPRIETLADADEKIRILNDEIRTLPKENGPAGLVTRLETVKALRDGVSAQLESLGEQGVRDVNTRFGALRNIEYRLRERGPTEAGKEARAPWLPDWAHAYMFGGAHGLALGMGVRAGRMFMPSDAVRLGKGMRMLGKTSLEPSLPQPPQGWGKQPIGLLPSPLRAGPVPDTSGSVPFRPPAVGEGSRATRLGLLLPERAANVPKVTPPRGYEESYPQVRSGSTPFNIPPTDLGTRAIRKGLQIPEKATTLDERLDEMLGLKEREGESFRTYRGELQRFDKRLGRWVPANQ
jgi:hypothetical protein